MEWNSNLIAIRFPSNETVHILERPTAGRLNPRSTYCGILAVEPYDDCSASDVNCETCITKLEKQQAYWKQFWASAEGIKIIKRLMGVDKLEAEYKKIDRELDQLTRKVDSLNNLLQDCMKHTQPIFTLELPDDVLLKLTSYGSVGEVLLAFRLSEESHENLKTELGKIGYALVGSRLIARGLLKPNDPIFNPK